MIYRTVIVDDEPPARRRLRKLLEVHHEVTPVGEAGSGSEAVRCIQEQRPDLVFLDIQLPNFDGFEVLHRLEETPVVIFTTGYDRYALRAFDAASIDYLLKPVEPKTLARAVSKLKLLTQTEESRALEQRMQKVLEHWQATSAGPAYVHKLAVRLGERALLIDMDDVSYFDAKDKYVFLHTRSGKEYIVDHTMAELESSLDPQKFVRVHRSTLVNLDQVKEIQNWFGGKYHLLLADGPSSEIEVSKGMAPKLKAVVPF